MPFDLNKCPKNEQGHWLAQTKDGRSVVVVCNNAPGKQPIIGLVGSARFLDAWLDDGRYINGREHDCDLVNATTKHEAVVEVWRRDMTGEISVCLPEQSDKEWRRNNGFRLVRVQAVEWEE